MAASTMVDKHRSLLVVNARTRLRIHRHNGIIYLLNLTNSAKCDSWHLALFVRFGWTINGLRMIVSVLVACRRWDTSLSG